MDDFGNYVKPVDLFKYKTQSNWITVYWYGERIDYELKVLTSQMKQEILHNIQSSIKGLAKRKAKGGKVGRLKYKSEVNVPLNQHNATYYLSDNAKKLRIQGNTKQSFQLVRNKNLTKLSHGLGLGKVSLRKLIDLNIIELANAELVGDKFNLTVYFNQQALKDANLFQGSNLPQLKDVQFGLDAGIASELTINTNEQNVALEMDARHSKSLKKLNKHQRRFNRHITTCKKKNTPIKTGKYWDLKDTIQRIHTDTVNQKVDHVNKLVSIFKECKQVTFQDEMIKAWHSNKAFGFSTKIQQGILGKLYAKLRLLSKEDNSSFHMLNRALRTTKTCICGTVNSHIGLKDRVYECLTCGYLNSRDIHSSYIMNNTVNYEGSGKESSDPTLKHTLLLDSNLGKTIISVNTQYVKNIVDSKLKSNTLRSTLVYNVTNTQEASSFRAG